MTASGVVAFGCVSRTEAENVKQAKGRTSAQAEAEIAHGPREVDWTKHRTPSDRLFL